MNENSPSREIILRAVQKDKELVDVINQHFLKFIDSLTHYLSINMHSNNLESIIKFIFYFSSYFIRKNKCTPGEEYTEIYKKFADKSNRSILIYIILLSIKNFLIKYFHNLVYSYFSKVANNNLTIKKTFQNYYSSLYMRIISSMFENFPSFEDVLEKIDEFRYCIFFIKGSYYDLTQRILGINYLTDSEKSEIEIIDKKGFIFIGYLLAFKLVVEHFQKIKNFLKLYKEEKSKLKKEIEENRQIEIEDSKRINIKLKSEDLKQRTSANEDENCLLCLDSRKNTSSTLCGHLFCWSCITNYLQTTPQCPFCRKECFPQNVLFLCNYK